MDVLGALVEKSLVQYEDRGGEARYRLLETIRQYGAEKLESAGEEATLRSRHRDWYLALAEQAAPELRGAQQREWLVRLQEEHENLRVALAWCRQRGEAAPGLRLGGALWRFWYVRGYLTEGRDRMASVLGLPGAEGRTPARARALNGAGILAWGQRDYGVARALYEESLAIFRELGDRQGIANSLNNLGIVAQEHGDYGAARALHEEGLAIARELGSIPDITYALNRLGLIAEEQGEYEAARSLYEEGLANGQELGDPWGTAWALTHLGKLAWRQGIYAAARSLVEESLPLRRNLGNKVDVASTLFDLGLLATTEGDFAAARSHLEESLAIGRKQGNNWVIAGALEGFAGLSAAQGQAERTARLFGAAEGFREAAGPRSKGHHNDCLRSVAAVREQLDEAGEPRFGASGSERQRRGPGPGFAAALAEGRALSLEQAVALALEEPLTHVPPA